MSVILHVCHHGQSPLLFLSVLGIWEHAAWVRGPHRAAMCLDGHAMSTCTEPLTMVAAHIKHDDMHRRAFECATSHWLWMSYLAAHAWWLAHWNVL